MTVYRTAIPLTPQNTKPVKPQPAPRPAQTPTTPQPLPWEQAQQDLYRLQNATIKDLQAKYGFDYSREYANRQAELERQAKQAAIQQQMQQLDAAQQDINRKIDQDYFQRYMQLLQQQTNTGMNAGIAADQNLRLDMNRQNQLAQYMTQNQLQRDQLMQQLAGLGVEAQAKAEQLYQDRLQKAFENTTKLDELRNANLGNLMDYDQAMRQLDFERYKWNTMSAEQRAQNQLAWAQLQWAKQQFATEQQWRQYVYNHMSASERAQLDWMKQQFGDEMAWKIAEANMTNQLEWAKLQSGLGWSAGGGIPGGGFLEDYQGGW